MKKYRTPEQSTILIVDDQAANIRTLAKLLHRDYRIQVATSGQKTLQLAGGEDPPDLILLDIEMPEMNGFDVCRRLKANEQTNSIPIIFVTARNAVEDEEKGFQLGAVDYISKPYHPAIVRARVRNQMELKIKKDMLENLSMQDGLTNIPNRRYFDQQLQEEWQRNLRHSRPISLLMLDIDYFKRYNDHYGHGAGDDCLRRVARKLKDSLSRPMDLVARYGGEEFVVLLPETHEDGALHVANNLRVAIEALAIPHQYSCTASVVTLSIGTATHSQAHPKKNREKLLQAADSALYRAKKKGRNRVCSG